MPDSALRILDVGCSDGTLGASLRAAVPGRCVHGIEFDPAFCERAKARLDSVVQADLNSYAWNSDHPVEYFDCIIFADVLEHLNQPWLIVQESTRLLAADGVIIVSFPNIRHLSALHSIFVKGTFPRANRGIFDRTHLRWFTLADGIEMCRSASLCVEHISGHLRLFDAPGGRVNNWVQNSLKRFESYAVVREFLAYQFVLVAKRVAQ